MAAALCALLTLGYLLTARAVVLCSPNVPRPGRILVIGGDDPTNKGIGNLLVFFPAELFFALYSSRSIAIAEQSYIGHFCRVIRCGFPFWSEVKSLRSRVYDGVMLPVETALAASTISPGRSLALHDKDTVDHMYSAGKHPAKHSVQSESKSRPTAKTLRAAHFADPVHWNDQLVVTASGYDSKSDWWAHAESSTRCIADRTYCPLHNVTCAETFAFRQLVKGPFLSKSVLLPHAKSVISGVPPVWIEHLFDVEWTQLSHFDGAVHFRNQFVYFEMERDIEDKEFKDEVATWLQGTEALNVFTSMCEQLVSIATELRRKEITVYVAADNESVKRQFVKFAQSFTNTNNNSLQHADFRFVTMNVDARYHIKNLQQLEASSKGKGLFNLVFDWLALSLSQTALSWRRGGTRSTSTFLASTRHLLDNAQSWRLAQTKRGEYVFEQLAV